MAQEHCTSATVCPLPDTMSNQVMLDLLAYQAGFWQRSMRYLDTLHQRSNKALSNAMIASWLELASTLRNSASEIAFRGLYGWPWAIDELRSTEGV